MRYNNAFPLPAYWVRGMVMIFYVYNYYISYYSCVNLCRMCCRRITTLNQETPRRQIETVYSLLWSKCNVTGLTDEKRNCELLNNHDSTIY